MLPLRQRRIRNQLDISVLLYGVARSSGRSPCSISGRVGGLNPVTSHSVCYYVILDIGEAECIKQTSRSFGSRVK
jgi:hypothetical protein